MADLTPEEQKISRDEQELNNLINSDGWAIVRRKLEERMDDVASIFSLDTKEKVSHEEVGGRQIALELIMGWFKDIDSEIAGYKYKLKLSKGSSQEEEVIMYAKKDDGS